MVGSVLGHLPRFADSIQHNFHLCYDLVQKLVGLVVVLQIYRIKTRPFSLYNLLPWIDY